MIINKIQRYERVALFFLAIVVIGCIADVVKRSIHSSNEEKVYSVINHMLTLKLKDETSYSRFCTKNGLQEVEKNWPVKTNSFYVAIEDVLFGSYEGKVFFDTGDVFIILTTKREGRRHKIDSFEKLQWPDREKGDSYWHINGN